MWRLHFCGTCAEKEFDEVSSKLMATAAINGGLEGLVYLGTIDGVGTSHRAVADRRWRTSDNGNPPNMLGVVRDLMGPGDRVLFIVERDFNRNVAMYRPALLSADEVDTNRMVGVTWLLVNRDADLENLDGLFEENLTVLEEVGYGVDVVMEDDMVFSIRSLPDTPLFLVNNGGWCVQIEIASRRMTLTRIILHTTKRAFGLFPGVTEVHLEVEDPRTGAVEQHFYAVK